MASKKKSLIFMRQLLTTNNATIKQLGLQLNKLNKNRLFLMEFSIIESLKGGNL
jgi:hypothetical protein